MQFEMLKDDASIIKVIGVGGGGGNAINHMYKQGIKGVDFIICNTDAQALELSPVPNKIQLGSTLTEGRGAGSMPEVGRYSAIENIDEIKQLLGNTKMVFITAGMGGGTGTGASPIIAQACRDLGILTVGIVTTPFAFEGKRRRLQAEEGLEELKKNVDTLLVISNDKMREMFGNLTLSNAFGEADDILTTAAKGIAEIITVPGYINVDFEDVRTVMKDSGAAIMGSCTAKGDDRARKAVVGALSSPLLNDNEIEGARYILLNISSGTNEVLMDEVTIITDYIQEEAGLTADIIWGNCFDAALEDELCVTIIATGFQTRREKEIGKQKAPEKIVKVLRFDELQEESLESRDSRSHRMNHGNPAPEKRHAARPEYLDEPHADEPYIKSETITRTVETLTIEESIEHEPFRRAEQMRQESPILKDPFLKPASPAHEEQPLRNRQVSIFDIAAREEASRNEIRAEAEKKPEAVHPAPGIPASSQAGTNSGNPAGPDEVEDDPMRKTRERIMRLKELSMKLRTSRGIEDLENVPAYIRKQQKLDKVPYSSQEEESRFTAGEQGEIRPNNSFLHDNVD